MQEANKFKLGLFVLISIVTLIIAISFMGLFDDFQPKAHIVTYVEESVQGLNTGSAVKYKGVRIGNVEDIFIIAGTRRIKIDITIDLTKFKKRTSDFESNESFNMHQFYSFLKKEIYNGLACRIEPDGITGIKYIEMDFFRKSESPKDAVVKNGILYMPSTPSMLSNLKLNVVEILASIAAVDFKGISDEIKTLLQTSNTTIKNAQLEKLVTKANSVADKLDSIAGRLNHSFTQQKINKMANNIDYTIESVKKLSSEMNSTLQKAQIPNTTATIRELSNSLHDNSASLQMSLQKINDAVDALTELIIYLNDNPTSLLKGRGKEKDYNHLK